MLKIEYLIKKKKKRKGKMKGLRTKHGFSCMQKKGYGASWDEKRWAIFISILGFSLMNLSDPQDYDPSLCPFAFRNYSANIYIFYLAKFYKYWLTYNNWIWLFFISCECEVIVDIIYFTKYFYFFICHIFNLYVKKK